MRAAVSSLLAATANTIIDNLNPIGSGTILAPILAINANKSAEIKNAVNQLMAHGITKDKIKGKLSDWKKEYMAAKGNKKVAIKNALIIAYKAIGISEKDANEIINKWK